MIDLRLAADKRPEPRGRVSSASQAWALRRAALSLRRLRMMPGSSINSSISASLICASCTSKPYNTSR
jgi:hypothetical protein